MTEAAARRAVPIAEAREPWQVAACRELLDDYRRDVGSGLCFQGFERELAGLPGDYAAPGGALWVAGRPGEWAGCIALRALGPDAAEVKRLYVRPPWRGSGLGRRLAEHAIAHARRLGYARLELETLPEMAAAQALYAALGFRDRTGAAPGAAVRAMALELCGGRPAG